MRNVLTPMQWSNVRLQHPRITITLLALQLLHCLEYHAGFNRTSITMNPRAKASLQNQDKITPKTAKIYVWKK